MKDCFYGGRVDDSKPVDDFWVLRPALPPMIWIKLGRGDMDGVIWVGRGDMGGDWGLWTEWLIWIEVRVADEDEGGGILRIF